MSPLKILKNRNILSAVQGKHTNIPTRIEDTSPNMILTSKQSEPKVEKGHDIFRRIFARKRFDITWQAISRALSYVFVRRQAAEQSMNALECLWAPQQTLVALTVRSGFDLCL